MSREWYYKLMGEEFGPLSSHELRQHALSGKVTLESHVRRGDSDRWVTADSVKGLFDAPAPGTGESEASTSTTETIDQKSEASKPPALPSQQAELSSTEATLGTQHDVENSPPITPQRDARPVPVRLIVGGIIALLACISLIVMFAWPRDPTARFKSFVSKASDRLKADEELNKEYIFEDVQFNVEKTSSTISPFTGYVLVTAVYIPAANEEDPADDSDIGRLLRDVHDYGDRVFRFDYAYQDHNWVLKDAEAKTKFSGALGAVAAAAGPPKKLIEHFAP